MLCGCVLMGVGVPCDCVLVLGGGRDVLCDSVMVLGGGRDVLCDGVLMLGGDVCECVMLDVGTFEYRCVAVTAREENPHCALLRGIVVSGIRVTGAAPNKMTSTYRRKEIAYTVRN